MDREERGGPLALLPRLPNPLLLKRSWVLQERDTIWLQPEHGPLDSPQTFGELEAVGDELELRLGGDLEGSPSGMLNKD